MNLPITYAEMQSNAGRPMEWLWDGLLLPRSVTLLTAQWKAGKTTLISLLLHTMADGGLFLGRKVRPARVLVLSEEGEEVWRTRGEARPFGPHLRFHLRPFRGRPTFAEWECWIAERTAEARAGALDLVVIDPASALMPITSEACSTQVNDALAALQPLRAAGAAVLILHHPRKRKSEEGQAARGSGAWGASADVLIEMRIANGKDPKDRRRILQAMSRFPDTPRLICGELVDGAYQVVDADKLDLETCDYAVLLSTLDMARHWRSVKDILDDWPEDHVKPHRCTLARWLREAAASGMIASRGDGLRNAPYQYALHERLPVIQYWNTPDPRTGLTPLHLDADEIDAEILAHHPALQKERVSRATAILKQGIKEGVI